MSRYIQHQGLVIRGIFNHIRGLCVLQTENSQSIFFIPEDAHQNNDNFFNISDFTNISNEEKEHLHKLYGYKTKGRWIDSFSIAWMDEDLSLFSFITSSELTFHQMIIQLHKEIK